MSCKMSQSPEGSAPDFHQSPLVTLEHPAQSGLNPPKGRLPISTLFVSWTNEGVTIVSIPRRVGSRFPRPRLH